MCGVDSSELNTWEVQSHPSYSTALIQHDVGSGCTKWKERALGATKVVTTEVGDTMAAGKCIDDNNENYARVKYGVMTSSMRKICGRVRHVEEVFTAADKFPISYYFLLVLLIDFY